MLADGIEGETGGGGRHSDSAVVTMITRLAKVK